MALAYPCPCQMAQFLFAKGAQAFMLYTMYKIVVALSLSILGEKHVDLVIFTNLVKLIKFTCESGVLST